MPYFKLGLSGWESAMEKKFTENEEEELGRRENAEDKAAGVEDGPPILPVHL